MKVIEYMVNAHGNYFAYLQDENDESIWNWDEYILTKDEFLKKYDDGKNTLNYIDLEDF